MSRSKDARFVAPVLESLEGRRLMSTVSLTRSALTVRGDAAKMNVIDVALNNAGTSIVVTMNGAQRSYAASRIDSISITGGSVRDRITVAREIDTPAVIDGGGGNDVIRGGGGDDTISGGTGADWVEAGPGADRIDGGTGGDTVVYDPADSFTPDPDDYVVRGGQKFKLYDATSFLNKPDTSQLGMSQPYIVNTELFANGDDTNPNEAATRAFATRVAKLNVPVVVDIETWPIDVRIATASQVNNSVNKFIQIADWMHSAAPGLRVSFYGVLPLRDYWTPVLYQQAVATNAPNLADLTAKYQAWQAANNVLKPLADKVDFICPSLYTFYNDPASWQTYATANISEARRLAAGKPVLPFLWMYYHNSNATLKGQLIYADSWQTELDTVRRQADGVVLWGGWQLPFDSTADWWTISQEFARREQAAL